MKKSFIIFILAALLLCGCGAKQQESQEPYSSVINGVEYYVNPEAKTITAQGHVFHYQYINNDSYRGVSITYPNGAIVTESYSTDSGLGGVSWSNADPNFAIDNGNSYADCYDLLDAVPEQVKEEKNGEMLHLLLWGIPLIAVGIWEAARPYTHWNWAFGWRYKDAEPSDEALGRIMAMGYFEIAIGVILVLIGIFA